MPHNKPPIMVPHIPNDSDSDPSSPYSSLLESDVRVRKIGAKSVTMTQLKIDPSLKPIYLKLFTVPIPQGLKWMKILYSAGFI